MKKLFKILLWVLVAAVFVGTFVYLFLNSKPKETVYDLVSPTTETIERTSVLTGKIEPRDEIEIKPQISGIISESREKYESDLAAYERAKAELAQAEDQLTIVRDGVSAANAQSSNTLVRSTVTGVVLEVPVKVGSSVIQANTFNDGTTVAKVADMTDLLFKGKVDETEVDLLSEGMNVRISVGAVSGSDYEAVIEKIAPMATDENGTNTFEVKAALRGADSAKLRAGYSANATVILERADSVMALPESVVEYVADSAFVYVLKSEQPTQQFERTAIKTGVSDGINVQLLSPEFKPETRLRGSEAKK